MADVAESIFNAIAKQEVLEPIANAVQSAVRGSFRGEGGRQTKNFLHGTWLGHPLHPVLTDIPVGAWTVAAICDLVAVAGDAELEPAADASIAIGLAGAVGAAVTGLTDFSETDGRGKRLGIVHGALNVVATALYTSSLVMRLTKKNRGNAVALALLGYAISGASAYIGGHLVFGEQIGVDHTATADDQEPRDFKRVAALADIADGVPTRAVVDGIAVLLVRRGAQLFAISETCSHLGGPLAEGKLEGNVIECPWHRSRFSIENGEVIDGPATAPARCFEVRVVGGDVEVRAANKQAAINEQQTT